jgi:hypothetical protein
MVRPQVVTLSILEGLLSCNPCYQSRLLQVNFAKSGVKRADLGALQNLRRPRRHVYSLLCSMVCLFLILSKLPETSERLASTGKISTAPKHSAASESR